MSETCEQTGKIGYPSPQRANEAIRRIRSRRGRDRSRYAYQCDDCHQWHITSQRDRP